MQGTPQLGDVIHQALDKVGITHELVEKWLGPDCGCEERQQKLNAVGLWANRILGGKLDKALLYLHAIIKE